MTITETSPPASNDLLTVREVAARFRVHEQTVRAWIRSGRMPAIHVSRSVIRIPRTAAEFNEAASNPRS